jgi:hypothetical protein
MLAREGYDPHHLAVLSGSGFFGNLWGKIKGQFTDPNSLLRGKILPIAAATVGNVPGIGTAIKAANYVNQGAKALGYGKDDEEAKPRRVFKKSVNSGYVRLMIAKGELDPSQVSNPSADIQKRVEAPKPRRVFKKKPAVPTRSYETDEQRAAREKKNKKTMAIAIDRLQNEATRTDMRNFDRRRAAEKALNKPSVDRPFQEHPNATQARERIAELRKFAETESDETFNTRIYHKATNKSKTRLKKFISTLNSLRGQYTPIPERKKRPLHLIKGHNEKGIDDDQLADLLRAHLKLDIKRSPEERFQLLRDLEV